MPWRFENGIKLGAFDDSSFILDIPRGKYFSLNETGTAICAGVQECEETDAIIRRVGARYSETSLPPTIESDVLGFLQHLQAMHLCQYHEPA